jgi:hypothetical protein
MQVNPAAAGLHCFTEHSKSLPAGLVAAGLHRTAPDEQHKEADDCHTEAKLADGSGQPAELLLQRGLPHLSHHQRHGAAPLAVLAHGKHQHAAAALGDLLGRRQRH